MKRTDIRKWAANLMESDQRPDWQRVEPITGQDVARIVRSAKPCWEYRR